ncbi:alpha/beta fold hydrolase [Streptomyces nigra]|uniref:alpha/beta fold hydrolase n=1 Tax=Streptomyces nigra TaxID=1827580 RepID=UPI00380AC854
MRHTVGGLCRVLPFRQTRSPGCRGAPQDRYDRSGSYGSRAGEVTRSGGHMARQDGSAGFTHRTVLGPAGRIHLVEQGAGPLVLLVHGFPESWYSWRRQLPALAAAGYRAVALDVRGYGRSAKPAATDAYRMLDLVADNVAVVHALGEESAVVVGHDWGATIAANSGLVRPDVFRAVGMLSVPYVPRGGPRPGEVFAGMGGERSSTCRTSRSRAAPRPRSSRTYGAGSPASTRRCPPTPWPGPAPPIRTSSARAGRCGTGSRRGRCPAGSARRTSTCTPVSSSGRGSPARSTATGTWTATGRTSPRTTGRP